MYTTLASSLVHTPVHTHRAQGMLKLSTTSKKHHMYSLQEILDCPTFIHSYVHQISCARCPSSFDLLDILMHLKSYTQPSFDSLGLSCLISVEGYGTPYS